LEKGGGATPFSLLDLENRDSISIPPPLPKTAASYTLSAQWKYVEVVSDGSQWL